MSYILPAKPLNLNRRLWRAMACGLLLLTGLLQVGFNPAFAAGLGIAPIRVEFSGAEKIAVVTLTNTSTEKTTIQSQAVQWQQDAQGQEVYLATSDLLVFPPVFTLEPGQSQTVRVGLRNLPVADTELSYRIFFQEVPAAAQPGQVKLAVRHGIPVFVKPAKVMVQTTAQVTRIAPVLKPDTKPQPASAGVLIGNQGNVHLQVRGIAFAATDVLAQSAVPSEAASSVAAKTVDYEPVFGYVLPGKSKTIPVKQTIPAGAKFVILDTDQGERAVPLDGK